MNKYSTLLLAGAVALSFASCQKDNTSGVVNPDSAVGTFASIRAAESEAGLKAVTDGQNDVEGVGAESKVKDGLFYSADGSTIAGYLTTGLRFDPVQGAAERYWETPVFKYKGTTGTVNSALILNAPSTVALAAATEFQISDLASLTSDNGFTMTSTSAKQIEIKPDIAEAQVTAGTNQFDYVVERVASKVQVTKSTQFNNGLQGELTDFRYSVAGSAKKVFAFADKAGSRTLSNTDPAKGYENFESAIEGVAVSTYGAGEQFDVRRDLTLVSDEAAQNVVAKGAGNDWATLRSITLKDAGAATYTSASSTEGIYFLENSLPASFVPSKDNPYRYGDITYVKIYAKYVPAQGEVLKMNADGNGLVAATQEEVAQEHAETADGLTATYEAGSFFRGTKTKKLYLDLKAARFDGNEKSELYKGGKMVWMTPANRQVAADDKNTTVYAETRRNNIYSLSVDAILSFGNNGDPIDPTDPNIPTPTPEENPDEPTDPQNPPVDDHATAIQVRAAILNWNLVHRGVSFGN